MSGVTTIIVGLVPSIGLGLIFWYVMRAIIRADRNERAAEARFDAERDHADGPR
jgi:hypothetical protein